MIIEIEDIGEERVKDFARLTEAELRNRLHPEDARIIVESPKVIKVALQQGYKPLSILCERRHIEGDAAEIIAMAEDADVYTADRSVLAALTGYTLTRGVLANMRRPAAAAPEEVMHGASRVCILDGVCDSTNIGAIFRSAAALGMDAILLTRSCCDPYNRRAIRVSMGSVFLIPWTWIDDVNEVKDYGFKTVAMALRHDSIALDDSGLKSESRLALVMGTEGDGLAERVIHSADYVVKIPMHHEVDSLNVAAASAVAFWELSRNRAK
ncbi:MAG: RNA methyltransferase [Muribaculaceae bacterium]|nr:RNA methyltransferase [Muribaculaceae bacterium]